MIKMCEVVCPDKKQAFSPTSLSNNTVADELANNLQNQLKEKGKDFIAYSLAMDQSRDITDTAQLSIFICGVNSDLCITEELLGIKAMHGTTTGKDIFEQVSYCVNNMKLPWNTLVGLMTDGAPAMCGEKTGLGCGRKCGTRIVQGSLQSTTPSYTKKHCMGKHRKWST